MTESRIPSSAESRLWRERDAGRADPSHPYYSGKRFERHAVARGSWSTEKRAAWASRDAGDVHAWWDAERFGFGPQRAEPVRSEGEHCWTGAEAYAWRDVWSLRMLAYEFRDETGGHSAAAASMLLDADTDRRHLLRREGRADQLLAWQADEFPPTEAKQAAKHPLGPDTLKECVNL
jgi:hypothetical protein